MKGDAGTACSVFRLLHKRKCRKKSIPANTQWIFSNRQSEYCRHLLLLWVQALQSGELSIKEQNFTPYFLGLFRLLIKFVFRDTFMISCCYTRICCGILMSLKCQQSYFPGGESYFMNRPGYRRTGFTQAKDFFRRRRAVFTNAGWYP